MSPDQRERMKDILAQAASLGLENRRAFVEHAAADDPAILVEALDLLQGLNASGFMAFPTGAGVAPAMDAAAAVLEKPGAMIGRYKLLQRVGEGGFGVVFMAEQTEPVIRRVALKIIKAGMDTRHVIARFEAERQALAMMDHPNIARVFDAGATDAGRPYFVMELVRGEPVTHYCDRAKLSIEDRLSLFGDICGAVQHAHQKGIIHRDLKPSNVLVTVADGRPLPKVIDFGIAKATGLKLTDKTLFTELHQLVGTPEYMSPEQAEISGVDVDTRSDLYSLGVLLYELLAGGPPFDSRRLRSAPFAEIQRIIRDEEPPRPSHRLRTLAASSNMVVIRTDAAQGPSTDGSADDIAHRRRTEPGSLAKSLNGDLDWIVMKCLEKDRSRRYETAAALAGDIKRYLAHEPVTAMPPSAGYKIRKFAQRHRAAVLMGMVIASTLILASGVSIAFAVRASRALGAEEEQRQRAEKAAAETELVADFQQAQLSGIDPEQMGTRLRDALLAEAKGGMTRAGLSSEEIDERGRQLESLLTDINPTNIAVETLNENIFERAIKTAREQFADQPIILARLLQSLTDTLRSLGMSEKALELQTESLDIRRGALPPDDPATLASISNMSVLLMDLTRYQEAESFAREALNAYTRLGGKDTRESLAAISNLGMILLYEGKHGEAEPFFRDLLDRHQRAFGPDDDATIGIISNVGGMLFEMGKLDDAEVKFREAYERQRTKSGDDDIATMRHLNNLAIVIEKKGRPEQAEPLYREAFNRARRALGEDHPDTLLYMSNLGFTCSSLDNFAEAEQLSKEALDRRRRTLGNNNRDTLQSMHNYAVVLKDQAKFDEAEPFFREAIEGRRRVFGSDYSYTQQSVATLGVLLRRAGKLDQAEPLLREALDTRRRILGNEHLDALESMTQLGDLFLDLEKPAEAELLYREAAAHCAATLSPTHQCARNARLGLAHSLLFQDRFLEAEPVLLGFRETFPLDQLRPGPRRSFIEAMIRLYEAREQAAPNQGFEEKAAQWRAKREPAPTTNKST